MPNLDNLSQIFSAAAKAAAGQLSTAGKNLLGDVENFAIPELRSLAEELVLLRSRVGPNGISEADAKEWATAEAKRTAQRIAWVATEMVLLEAQKIVDAALAAAKTVINTSFGFALFP
jgi:hypothetical protein